MATKSKHIDIDHELMQHIESAAKAAHVSPGEYINNVLQKQIALDAPAKNIVQKTNISLPAEVKLYGDGGSRGNPGPAAGGFVVLDMQNTVLHESGKYLGIATNNYAEYHSLKGGLELCAAKGVAVVHVYMDSLLVINQMKGSFKVRHETLIPIHAAIKALLPRFDHVDFTHVPRELNKLADAEVNKTLDAVAAEK